jgi:hypothetical protein
VALLVEPTRSEKKGNETRRRKENRKGTKEESENRKKE